MDLASLERRALELAKQGDFGDEAAAVNAAIVDQAPKNAAALKRLGRCHLEQRRFDEAVDLLRRALALNPTDTIASNLLAEVRKRRALTPKAAERAATGFGAREFALLETLPPDQAARRLAPRTGALLTAINASSIAERIVAARRRRVAAGDELFHPADLIARQGHLHLVHHGGRFEPQWRMAWSGPPALDTRAFCAGLGFDGAGEGAEAVARAFERFQQALAATWRGPLAEWMAANGGFTQSGSGGPAVSLAPGAAVDALTDRAALANGFVFVGRWWFLDRIADADALADRAKLARLVEDTFRTLVPLWLAAYERGPAE
jgi:tetratricopeptide (TPR) repeat protein